MDTRSRKMVQMCLSSTTNPIMLPKWETTKCVSLEGKNNILKDLSEYTSLLPMKSCDSENHLDDSPLFSSDSEQDPTYVPDSDYSEKETEDPYEYQTASQMNSVSSFKNKICNAPLSAFEPSTSSNMLENKKINILSNVIVKSTATSTSHHYEDNDLHTNSSCTPVKENEDENVVDSTTPEEKQAETSNKMNFRKKKYKCTRKPDFCFFCENEVQNFARHIQRNHRGETEVEKILTLPQKSIERKRAIACLRKKGNFIQNSVVFFKPVHKSLLNNSEENYIPCPFCLGSYSRKLLWKHKKVCPLKRNSPSTLHLSEGQNLMIPNTGTNFDLKTKVFPRMLADKISLTAKKDALICTFGSRYLNTHREQHHVNVCSRKMRELAKVLIESRKLNSSIKNLFDLLQPQFFDIVVQSVKIIAKYDPQKDMFESPTFAMNISRSLKDCCDIAVLHIIKRKYNYSNISASEAEANIGVFRRLLENMWKHEISSQAGNDLNTKTWNKITLVPLAADLKLFRKYLIEKAKEAALNLQQDIKNFKAFTLLMETVFCRLLLLNRKRVGELQRMKVATYMLTEETNKKNYEEFTDAITPAEKVLLKHFKRVVTRGKRERGVPVLFSTDIQQHINLLLRARSEFVRESNLFLFANPASEQQPILGYKIIQKHARLSGARNPEALTSTKLRKHLATLTQIFSMTENDVEQLATFMGHTLNVHKQVYRLPDDVYQTAKIAKLLILMERGEAGKYKGKTLDEIDLNMDDEIINENEINDDLENDIENNEDKNYDVGQKLDEDIEKYETNSNEDSLPKTALNLKSDKSVMKSKKRVLIPWTSQQKKIVTDFFKTHIKEKKAPKKEECVSLIKMYHDVLANKSWTKIKVFVQNLYVKKTKFDSD